MQPDEVVHFSASLGLSYCRPNYILWIAQIAALQLLEQGKIQLSTPVSTILPELVPVIPTAYGADGKPTATTPAKNPITFGHLLNHTSGMEYNLGETPGVFPEATRHAYDKNEDSSTFMRHHKVLLPILIASKSLTENM